MEVTVKSFRGIIRYVCTLFEGELVLLEGPSGAGKTTLMRAIQWCLYGGKGDTAQVSLETGEWLVRRAAKPTRITAGPLSGLLEGEDAIAWIVKQFGSARVWTLGSLHRLHGANVLMQNAHQEEKMSIVREIAFAGDDIEARTTRIAAYVKEETVAIKDLEITLTALLSAIGPHPNAYPVKSVAQAQAEIDKLERTAPVEADKQQALRDEIAHNEGILAAHDISATDIVNVAGMEEAYSSGTLPAQWRELEEALKAYQARARNIEQVTINAELLQGELLDLDPDSNAQSLASLPNAHDLARQALAWSQQSAVGRRLGLPSGADLTASIWDEAMGDAHTWNQYRKLLGTCLEQSASIDSQSKALDLRVKAMEITPDLADYIAPDLLPSHIVAVRAITNLANAAGIEPWANGLQLRILDRISSLEALIATSAHTDKWEKARDVFAEVKRREPTKSDAGRLRRLKEQLFQESLTALACPACNTALVMQEGELAVRVHQAIVGGEALRNQIAEFEAQDLNHAECQALVEHVKSMGLDTTYRNVPMVPPGEVESARRVLYPLQGADIAIATLPGVYRKWVIEHAEEYIEVEIARTALAERAAAVERHAEGLRVHLGDLTGPTPADVLRRWWARDGLRGVAGDLESVVANVRNVPFAERPDMTVDALERCTKINFLRANIAGLRESLDAMRSEPVPELLLPAHPVYDAIEASYFRDMVSLASINDAVEQVKNIVVHVEERQRTWNTHSAGVATNQRVTRAGARLEELRPLLVSAEQAARDEATRRADLDAVRQLLPWLEAKERIVRTEADNSARQVRLATAKNLLVAAHATEVDMLNGFVQHLATSVNEILAEIFETDATLEMNSYKTTKTTKTTKVNFNIAFTHRGVTYEDLDSLSDGENMRISLAITLAIARQSRFPLIMIDESLSTLPTEMRQTVADAVRRCVPHKAVLVVMHAAITDFDRTISI